MEAKPKIIIFDLDYTLWPFWVDTHVTPPFRRSNGKVVDSSGQKIRYYKDVPEILTQLKKDGYQLGVASRTSEINGAKQLLKLFDWDKFFDYKEIYPGSKVNHFSRIQKASGVDYKDMLFFDDEHRNIVDVNRIGATAFLVKNELTHDIIKLGLQEFAKRNRQKE